MLLELAVLSSVALPPTLRGSETMITSRRVLLATAAASTLGGRHADASFLPTDDKVFKLAMESMRCREPGCRDAALSKLAPLLDVSGVPKNAKGEAKGTWPYSPELEIVKCAAFTREDEPGKFILRVKAVAESLDLVDYVSVIWLANVDRGTIMAARARTDDDLNGGVPVVNFETCVTADELLGIMKDVLVPRMYSMTHGLWEGKRFSLAEYLDKGGLGEPGFGESKVGSLV